MKALKWLDENFEEAVMIILLMFMTMIMGVQVCARYLFNFSLSWTEEITRYLFVWSGFLSIGFATQKAIAIRLEQLTEKLKGKVKSMVFIVDYVIEFVFFAYMIPSAWNYLMTAIESGQVSTACEMPMWFLQAAPFVGFVLVEVRLAEKIYREIKKGKGDVTCQQ